MIAIDKRQRNLLLGILGVITLIAILLLLPLLAPKEDSPEATLVGVIPEADLAAEEDSKTASYRKGNQIGSYWDSLEESGHDQSPSSSPQEGDGTSGRDPRRPATVGVDDLFGDYKETPSPESAPLGRKGGGKQSSGGGVAPKKASPQEAPPQDAPSQTNAPATPESGPPETTRLQVKRSGAVSSLDEDVAADLGNGFSTLDGTDRWVGSETGKPYRCMFTRDEKVRSGQRITLRLLEDLVIGGAHIPRNTHLQGLVKVSDRMEIRITSLDIGGRILSFHFEAYDTDGGKGIYCSDLSQTGKTITEQGIATVTSSLNSGLGRVARDAASVGASIVRNKSGEATVTVPAGYTFYIIEETK